MTVATAGSSHVASVRKRAQAIKLLACDVDGVLTDGTLYLNDRGEEMKAFAILDGHGIKLLQQTGVKVAIITGRNSQTVAHRARELGIEHVIQGASDKLAAWQTLIQSLALTPEECAYIGDDFPDLPVLRRCGLAVAVPNAASLVRAHAHYVARTRGGAGAVREVCELIMEAQGTLAAQQNVYLR
jgi:3-deoxy-D-manno-octulosonate 8-phosphate phosphatase (KDO 8-P phosphatase)